MKYTVKPSKLGFTVVVTENKVTKFLRDAHGLPRHFGSVETAEAYIGRLVEKTQQERAAKHEIS